MNLAVEREEGELAKLRLFRERVIAAWMDAEPVAEVISIGGDATMLRWYTDDFLPVGTKLYARPEAKCAPPAPPGGRAP